MTEENNKREVFIHGFDVMPPEGLEMSELMEAIGTAFKAISSMPPFCLELQPVICIRISVTNKDGAKAFNISTVAETQFRKV